jgi:hypothetical protein
MNKIDGTDDAINAQERQRGWAGEEMEMEHQREELRRRKRRTESQNPQGRQEERGEEEKYYHAVNLEQFRNNQVGSGYQAKGVIRQRTAHDVNINILDMSKRPENLENPSMSRRLSDDDRGIRKDDDDDTSSDISSSRRNKKRKKHHKNKRPRKEKKQKSNTRLIEKYLKCKGMRDFRKELEKILSE